MVGPRHRPHDALPARPVLARDTLGQRPGRARPVAPCAPRLPRRAAWYAKPEVTFSDALAAVRRQLWIAQAFSTSRQAQDVATIPRALLNSLTEAACYPA